MWSATADRLPGEPSSGVNDEKVALTATATWGRRLFVTGGVRYNLLLGLFDDEQLSLRVKVLGHQWLTLEHAFLAPTFDGDSIWNVFSTGATRDFRAGYELGLGEAFKLYARGFYRIFELTSDEVDTGLRGRSAWGGSAGGVWRQTGTVLRLDGYLDDGFGGRKDGVDLSGRWSPWTPKLAARLANKVELEGRLTGYRWRSDQQSVTDAGYVVGVQAGGRWEAGNGVRLHLLAEDNMGTFYRSQWRALAVVELSAAL